MNFLYYNMTCEITIGKIIFKQLASCLIESSIKKISDTAKLVLPREFRQTIVGNKVSPIAGKNITEFIKVDDPVTIKLGYDGDNQTEFEGYVTKIGADAPLVIECEDEMRILRKNNYVKVFAKVSLKELLEYVAPNVELDLVDNVGLGKFTIENESAYQILERLRKDYGLHSMFVGKVLTVGFPISLTPSITHEINMNRNVRAKFNSLKFVRREDIKLLLKAISINDGKRLTSDFGLKGGAIRTLHFTGKTLDELQNLAESNYKSLSFDGYQGSVPTWGQPRTKAGEAVEITDPIYQNSERDGKYLIEGVTIKFNNVDGFLRDNKLGLKL